MLTQLSPLSPLQYISVLTLGHFYSARRSLELTYLMCGGSESAFAPIETRTVLEWIPILEDFFVNSSAQHKHVPVLLAC